MVVFTWQIVLLWLNVSKWLMVIPPYQYCCLINCKKNNMGNNNNQHL